MGDLFFVRSNGTFNSFRNYAVDVLTFAPHFDIDAPVAQRIEHLPCRSLNGEAVWNPLSGRPCMRGRPESLWYFDRMVQVKIHEDWVIRRKPRRDRSPG
jgi:hypothetical protein